MSAEQVREASDCAWIRDERHPPPTSSPGGCPGPGRSAADPPADQPAEEESSPPGPAANGAGTTAPPGGVSFDAAFAALKAYDAERRRGRDGAGADGDGRGPLVVPRDHPALTRILDALAASSVESLLAARWDARLEELRAARGGDGDAGVAPGASPPPRLPGGLAAWAARQRHECGRFERGESSELTPDRHARLRDSGLLAGAAGGGAGGGRWEARLEELREFRARAGHCDVPVDHPGLLGVWVINQRDAYHFEREKMPPERIEALEGLGFNWNRWGRNRLKTREDAWERQFSLLVEFIKVHGHSNISQHDEENERLGKWVKNQRYEYRKYHTKGLGPSRLGRDRIDKLNEIGFQWRLRPERIPWEERFEALKRFKEENGHCRVPLTHPGLGKWVKYQRDQYCLHARGKKAKIDKDRMDKLLSLGFGEALDGGSTGAAGRNGEGATSLGVVPRRPHHEPIGGPVDGRVAVGVTAAHTPAPPPEGETGGAVDGALAYHHDHHPSPPGEAHPVAALAPAPAPMGEPHPAAATYHPEQYPHPGEPPGHAHGGAAHPGQPSATLHYPHGGAYYG